MKIYHDINDFQQVDNAVVTIGNFDGVHLGHREILKNLISEAKKNHGETVIVTFFPHPRKVLNINTKNLKFITSIEDKLHIFEKLGIDNVVIINFTEEFSKISSSDFLQHFIIEKIHPVKIVTGYDHRFGNSGTGNFQLLSEMAEKYGFSVEKILEKNCENLTVSSTLIRESLQKGDVKTANALLGYEYSYFGKVVPGQQIGRKIGFRTANLEIDEEFRLIEHNGVYATIVEIDSNQYKSMTYIGNRPTMNDGRPASIEVFVFDFNGDLYGKNIRLRFIDFVRDEQNFNSLQNLENQLNKDEEKIRFVLSQYEEKY